MHFSEQFNLSFDLQKGVISAEAMACYKFTNVLEDQNVNFCMAVPDTEWWT